MRSNRLTALPTGDASATPRVEVPHLEYLFAAAKDMIGEAKPDTYLEAAPGLHHFKAYESAHGQVLHYFNENTRLQQESARLGEVVLNLDVRNTKLEAELYALKEEVKSIRPLSTDFTIRANTCIGNRGDGKDRKDQGGRVRGVVA